MSFRTNEVIIQANREHKKAKETIELSLKLAKETNNDYLIQENEQLLKKLKE